MFELINPHRVVLPKGYAELQQHINQSSEIVQVNDLQRIAKYFFGDMLHQKKIDSFVCCIKGVMFPNLDKAKMSRKRHIDVWFGWSKM